MTIRQYRIVELAAVGVLGMLYVVGFYEAVLDFRHPRSLSLHPEKCDYLYQGYFVIKIVSYLSLRCYCMTLKKILKSLLNVTNSTKNILIPLVKVETRSFSYIEQEVLRTTRRVSIVWNTKIA